MPSSRLKILKIVCPHCGETISRLSPKEAVITCPYCKQEAQNPLCQESDFQAPERIIPFTLTEADFGRIIAESLVKKSFVPFKLFSEITFDNTIKLFLPMYVYKGSFSVSWRCEEGYTVKNSKGQNTTRYRPASGMTEGNYSKMSLGCKDENIPEALRKFAAALDYPEEASQAYSPELLNLEAMPELMSFEADLDARQLWLSKVKAAVERQAEAEMRRQLPNQKRNLKSSIALHEDDMGSLILAPFYFVNFYYQGKRHHFILDGSGKARELKAPFDPLQLIIQLVLTLGLGALGLYTAAWAGALVGAAAGWFGWSLFARMRRRSLANQAFPGLNL